MSLQSHVVEMPTWASQHGWEPQRPAFILSFSAEKNQCVCVCFCCCCIIENEFTLKQKNTISHPLCEKGKLWMKNRVVCVLHSSVCLSLVKLFLLPSCGLVDCHPEIMFLVVNTLLDRNSEQGETWRMQSFIMTTYVEMMVCNTS